METEAQSISSITLPFAHYAVSNVRFWTKKQTQVIHLQNELNDLPSKKIRTYTDKWPMRFLHSME